MWQCILTLINAGCALLSRDGQGLNYAGNPPISTSTTKLFPHDHTAPSPHQSPSTVEPNLGLEPNPQTLTSGQSLIVDRWFNVNNSSKQLIVLFKTLPQPTNLHLLASRGPNCPNYFPCTNYERFGPYIIGANFWYKLSAQIWFSSSGKPFCAKSIYQSLLIFLIFLLAQLTHYYYPAVCAINMGVIAV